MNKIKVILSVAILCALLMSCTMFDTEVNDMNNAKMTAKIIAIGEKIEVEVIEGEYDASGIYMVITNINTQYLDSDGSKTLKSNINVGDIVEIIYGGQVMMSYPPQIVAKKIIIK